jgi:hypothetical protein
MFHLTVKLLYVYIECSLDVQADTGISRKTESHSFGDHLISESVSVTRSRVTEASVVLCSVSLWLLEVNVQSACALNIIYINIYIHRKSVVMNAQELFLNRFYAQQFPLKSEGLCAILCRSSGWTHTNSCVLS